jgi:hypothetical protein
VVLVSRLVLRVIRAVLWVWIWLTQMSSCQVEGIAAMWARSRPRSPLWQLPRPPRSAPAASCSFAGPAGIELSNLKDVIQSGALCLGDVGSLPCVEVLECAIRSSVIRSVALPP